MEKKGTIKKEVPIPQPAPIIKEVPIPKPVPIIKEVPIPKPVPIIKEVPIPQPVPIIEEVPIQQPIPIPQPQLCYSYASPVYADCFPARGCGEFILIVVLFILLIIVGSVCFCGKKI